MSVEYSSFRTLNTNYNDRKVQYDIEKNAYNDAVKVNKGGA